MEASLALTGTMAATSARATRRRVPHSPGASVETGGGIVSRRVLAATR